MSKPARGTKRVCPSCGARFYDLGRSPAVCPVCQTVYQVTAAPARRERAAPVEVKKPAVIVADPPVLKRAEVVSLDEAEEAGTEVAIEDEEIVDLGDDDTEIPAAAEDDTFLEEEEEGEADVTGIVGGKQPEES